MQEIADWFGVSPDTIERRSEEWCLAEGIKGSFTELRSKFSSRTKATLRRMQIEVALKGSVPMLIFLGKELLGQERIGRYNPQDDWDEDDTNVISQTELVALLRGSAKI